MIELQIRASEKCMKLFLKENLFFRKKLQKAFREEFGPPDYAPAYIIDC